MNIQDKLDEIEEEITRITNCLTGDEEQDYEAWILLDELYEELADLQYTM